MKSGILINLNRCIGCWTCSMACKVGNELADDEFRINVRTLGSGAGIDRPSGVYPKLEMGWQPFYAQSCIFCAQRVKDGCEPYCTYNCPTEALVFGDSEDASSKFSLELKRLEEAGYALFAPPAWENSKKGIVYANRR